MSFAIAPLVFPDDSDERWAHHSREQLPHKNDPLSPFGGFSPKTAGLIHGWLLVVVGGALVFFVSRSDAADYLRWAWFVVGLTLLGAGAWQCVRLIGLPPAKPLVPPSDSSPSVKGLDISEPASEA
jgi:hypothetical protein